MTRRRISKLWRYLPGSLLTALIALLGCEAAKAPETESIEYAPPPITTASTHEIRGLIEAAHGSVVVVNLWATWCPPCVAETPALSRYYEDFHDRGVTFLSVSVDEQHQIDEVVRLFVNSYEIPFPVHVVGPQEQETINSHLGIDWDGLYPGTFLFGPDGTLAQTWAGEVTYDELLAATRALKVD